MIRCDRRVWALLPLVVLIGLGISGCGENEPAAEPVQPTRIDPIPGTNLNYVVLSRQAANDLGIRTQRVRRVPAGATGSSAGSGAGALVVIPTTAVIYDPSGRSWTYVIAAERTYVRKAIVIDRIDGDRALLRRGPPAGTPVVTVGASELIGAEYGVGKE